MLSPHFIYVNYQNKNNKIKKFTYGILRGRF